MPSKPEEWIAFAVCIALFTLLLSLFALVVRDTIRKQGMWGINLKSLVGIDCPACGEPLPAFRKPKNVNQALWGGCNCPECGCEIDKWGRKVEDAE